VRPWLSTGELQQPCQLTSAGLKASKYVLANTIDFHEPKTKHQNISQNIVTSLVSQKKESHTGFIAVQQI